MEDLDLNENANLKYLELYEEEVLAKEALIDERKE
jgi:hypothetical protein